MLHISESKALKDAGLKEFREFLSRPRTGAALDCDYVTIFPPITYFGGKRSMVIPVWTRFGFNVPNFIEPCAGGAAVFFGRPPNIHNHFRRELINDPYSQLINAYRTLKYSDPQVIADICDEPYFELDLTSWNLTMIENAERLRSAISKDPKYKDELLGSRWIWQNRGWIAGGACDPAITVNSKMPRSRIAGWHMNSATRLFETLKARLKNTQIYCGGFERAISSGTQTTHFLVTAIFIDPPYPAGFCSWPYPSQRNSAAWEAFEIAIKLGRDPSFRIAFCGYGRIFAALFEKEGWEMVRCLNQGGYSNQGTAGRGKDNRNDEYIWFSPGCLRP